MGESPWRTNFHEKPMSQEPLCWKNTGLLCVIGIESIV